MVLEYLFIVYVISSSILILFNLLSLFKLKGYKRKEHVLDIEDKPVSIVVCSHNDLDKLKKLLEQLYIQAYTDYEIVVVDDRSNDGTFDYLLEEKQKHKNLNTVRIDNTPNHINSKKYALTLGIKAAQHDSLLLTDADCVPVSINWVNKMRGQFNGSTDFILGFSYYNKYPGFLNFFIRHETIQTGLLYVTLALIGFPYMGVGRNMGYKKSFFLDKKGFNKFQKVTGGDDDLFVNQFANNRNTAVNLDPESLVYSDPKTSFSSYLTQKKRHLSVGKHYRFKHKFILGILALSKIIFWILGLSLLILTYRLYWVAGLFSVQLLLLLWTYHQFKNILKVKYEIVWLWLMDFMYISYLIVFSLSAFTAKRIKWS